MPTSPSQFHDMVRTVDEAKRRAALKRNPERVEMGPVETGDAPESESKLHSQIIEECGKRLWGYIHSRLDRRTTTNLGVVDFVILADGGRTFYIEAKMPGKKFSEEQNKFKAVAERNGHAVHRVENMDQFYDVVDYVPLTRSILKT